jgi:leucyl/phenylalanyl-tRNA--protein transferase
MMSASFFTTLTPTMQRPMPSPPALARRQRAVGYCNDRVSTTRRVARSRAGVIRIPILRAGSSDPFPPVESALTEPAGLRAAGGDLSTARLLAAYRLGIFPWYSRGQPILWWSPDPRTVFETGRMHVPRRLARFLRTCPWTLKADTAFETVIRACAAPRAKQRGTWLDPEMRKAYLQLHALGHAHSVEAWDGDALAGGIYGVSIGRMFFGESMFSAADNGSKVALLGLARAPRRGLPAARRAGRLAAPFHAGREGDRARRFPGARRGADRRGRRRRHVARRVSAARAG